MFVLLTATPTSRSSLPPAIDPLPSLPPLPPSKTTVPAKAKPTQKKSQPPAANKRADSQHSTLSSVPSTSRSEHSTAKSDSQLSHLTSNSFPSSTSYGQDLNTDPSQNCQGSTEGNDWNPHTSASFGHSSTTGISAKVASMRGTCSQDIEAGSTTSLKEPPTPLFVLEPGTFDIVLCVDSCETAGG